MDLSAHTPADPPHPLAARLAAHPLVAPVVPLAGEVPVHVVGGMVRDALIGRPHGDDVDLVVEGDAVALARRLARRLGVRVVAHERFGTAVLELPHGGHVDLITARRERYPRPGALPDVEPGDLADDLARRDFTVNAMALALTGPAAGALLDPWDGARDLARGVIRTLRPGAFHEDPSRVVRAARYAGRLGFALEDRTAREAAASAADLDWAAARVAEELRRLLDEDDPVPAVDVLAGLGAAWDAVNRDFRAWVEHPDNAGRPIQESPVYVDRIAIDSLRERRTWWE
jgi:tRNA nucleotidyltransferase (CCA-adding enzyme)